MTTDENTTPEPATTLSPKKAYLEQIIAEDRDYGFVVPADEMDD